MNNLTQKVNTVCLGELCDIRSGGTPSRSVPEYYGGDIPWVKISDIEKSNGLILSTDEGITKLGLKSIRDRMFGEGTLLFAMYGSIGKIAFAGMPLTTNQAILGITPKSDELEMRYLFWWFTYKQPQLLRAGRGVALKNLSATIVRNLEIPVPPLPGQQRIAEILDLADEARRKRRENLKLYDDLIRSLFLQTFGDPITNPMGWEECELHFHADIKSGVTKGRKFGGKRTVMAPYMRVANVQDGYLKLDDVAKVEVLPEDVQKYTLINGDILLTEGGDPDKLGRGAIWKGEIENCIHQNHIFRVRLDKKLLVPEYASALISSPRGKRYFLKAAKQTTGIASINMGQLKKCPMLLPPVQLQSKFSSEIAEINTQKSREQALYDQHDKLFNSLLQHAFTGTL